jgi:hypothetical protein
MLKLTDVGEAAALATFVNKMPSQNLRLHLHKNNLVLRDSTNVSELVEADFPGYASSVLTGALWAISAGAPSVAQYQSVSMVCSAAVSQQTIYGYYVTMDGAGDLMWGEAFPTPQIISAAGNRIIVTPRLTARDESD